ncbi:MAG: group 1 truncated hemoglobin [Planctomycetota bacterium]
MNETLFDRMGGIDAITDVVELLYRKVLRDDRVARFFDDADVEAQSQLHRNFLVAVLGGPDNYAGRTLGAAHSNLVDCGLGDYHFDVMNELFTDAMLDLDVSSETVSDVMTLMERLRGEVLGRTTVSSGPTRESS